MKSALRWGKMPPVNFYHLDRQIDNIIPDYLWIGKHLTPPSKVELAILRNRFTSQESQVSWPSHPKRH
jgi:hypothetical protein